MPGTVMFAHPEERIVMEPAAPTVGLIFDDRYLAHNTGLWLVGDVSPYPYPFADPVPHVSGPGLVGRPKHLMDLHGITDHMVRIDPLLATDEQLLVYHTPRHLRRVAKLSAGAGGDTGKGAPMGPGGEKIARLAAGGTIAATNAVMAGQVRSAYALVRPPGHHAMANHGMGFCVFANAVIAARHAQSELGAERILILDWDVHHGNGTQDAFWRDDSVLFISLHQDDLYPVGWGAAEHVGEGPGQGYSVNIPLPAGTGNAGYQLAYDRLVVPIVRQFAPDLIIVSAGQDASIMDPLARMSLTLDGFRMMTRTMMALADELCDGRLVVTQEGGYAAQYAPYCSTVIGETLVGMQAGIDDPYGPRCDSLPASREAGLDARAAVDLAVSIQGKHWSL
jgi:acetoin utilization deacetylase AcuC-like enzyme